MKRKKYIIIGIVALLILLLTSGFFGNKIYQDKRIELIEQSTIFGANNMLDLLMQKALECNKIPIQVEDKIYNLILAECLQGE